MKSFRSGVLVKYFPYTSEAASMATSPASPTKIESACCDWIGYEGRCITWERTDHREHRVHVGLEPEPADASRAGVEVVYAADCTSFQVIR